MTDPVPTDPADRNEGRFFRWLIGLIVLATAVLGFAMLFYLRVPAENKDAMMFALGSIFGWASAVVGSEYGATTTGRKVAESAIREIERQNSATNDSPTGTPNDPLSVAGAAPGTDPVKTNDAKQ